MGIICVLYDKALDGKNYYQWTWGKCARVITKNTTNLLCHFENKYAGVASVKELVRNNNKKGSVESGLATVQYIGSSPNTCVPSTITVTMKKSSAELVEQHV